ncbi:hypothetical protein [Streptomyces sp. NPDC059552]|uniref:hypothetical protein n=1 Tax=Streptomyces sp. NPDC059552 TaxID=3346862 RepID=UPI0036C93E9E
MLVDDSHQLALQARCNVADALAKQAMRQVLVLLTHDAGHALTHADFDPAQRIDAIVSAHQPNADG